MERIRVAAVVFSLLLLLQIIRAVRREHIRVEYSMAWFGAAVLLLALSISEPALRWLSLTLGIDDPSLVLVLIAGLLFLFTFFRASVQISELKDNSILLAQKSVCWNGNSNGRPRRSRIYSPQQVSRGARPRERVVNVVYDHKLWMSL